MGARGLINGVARNDDKSTIQQKCMEKYIPLTGCSRRTARVFSEKIWQTFQISIQNIHTREI